MRKLAVIAGLSVYLGLQLLVPLRHFAYPNVVYWTEDGQMFSWHMMLRSKEGVVMFRVVGRQSHTETRIDPQDFLDSHQVRMMAKNPTMILQFAHFLRDHFEGMLFEDVSVYAESFASLNGRPMQRFVSPTVDLAKERYQWFAATDWIRPLTMDPP